MRRGWVLGCLAMAAIAVGLGANALDDAQLPSGHRTVVHGAEQESVEAAHLQVRVHGAVASPQLDDGDEVITGVGTFVLIDLEYATTDSWWFPEGAVVVDGDGREYSYPSGFTSDGDTWIAGPDIWYRGQLLFEVPPDVVDDLTLEIRPETLSTQLPSTVIRIPLTVTTASAPVTVAGDELVEADS